MTTETTTVGIMISSKAMDRSPRAVVTQIAMHAFDMEEERILPDALHLYLPMQPQLDLIPCRTISADTLLWWMQQSDDTRAAFERNVSDDFEELPILMRQFVRRFNKLTNEGRYNYELIGAGPQGDIVRIESLLRDCGLNTPWSRSSVVDLRTLMRYAGLDAGSVEQPEGFVPARADWENRWQIAQFFAMKRALRAAR